ncbi:MAG: hypothetical protein OEZ06_24305 [Myxococcales bacterium]|nr:hypothetical protein [Myxococcales bacterium]
MRAADHRGCGCVLAHATLQPDWRRGACDESLQQDERRLLANSSPRLGPLCDETIRLECLRLFRFPDASYLNQQPAP